ncbi:MAG TPA: PQQ-binding-like beta-propeller repeat protein [Planctomycetota bacterium]|nr:PQQ-binding-like beta-propeller repeat protein [Planctomycetota bacterium]
MIRAFLLLALLASGDSLSMGHDGAKARSGTDPSSWLRGFVAHPGDSPMMGGRPDRNPVADEKNLPVEWKEDGSPVLKWAAALGDQTYGTPVISGGRVFIGTNNGAPRDPAVKGDKGVLMCFLEGNGRFLWQAVHDKLPGGTKDDWPQTGICSSPCVVGDRVYYVSNRAELVCADAQGFADRENDGPFADETRKELKDADFVWILDMRKELGVLPHQASASSPLVVGDLVFVLTGHGVDSETYKVKNPQAPSFVAVDRATGKVVWKDASPGANILGGQWGSPAYGEVDGKPQVVFPGGDGVLYAFEPATGKPLWKFDCTSHEKRDAEGLPESGNHLVATPVFAGHRVLIPTGHDTDTVKPGCLRAIDARTGKELWKRSGKDFQSSIATPAVHDGLVYAVDLSGILHVLDLETGAPVWTHDFLAVVWASPLVADGKVYVRTEEGDVVVLAAGREKKVLAKNSMPDLANGSIVAANGGLYFAGNTKLYALKRKD